MIQPGIEALTEALVDRLAPHLSPVPVEAFPDRPAQYREALLTSGVGVVLVGHARVVKMPGTEAIPAWSHDVRVNILTPGLHSDSVAGAYEIIEVVVAALDGVRTTIEGEPMRLECTEAAFVGYADGFWEWQVAVTADPSLRRRG